MLDRIERAKREKDEASKAQDFERAAMLRDREKVLRQKLDELEGGQKREKGRSSLSTVTGEDIADIVSSWTGIPVTRLVEEETQKLLRMEDVLHERVVGQDDAVRAVSKAVRRARAGLKDSRRPIGSSAPHTSVAASRLTSSTSPSVSAMSRPWTSGMPNARR